MYRAVSLEKLPGANATHTRNTTLSTFPWIFFCCFSKIFPRTHTHFAGPHPSEILYPSLKTCRRSSNGGPAVRFKIFSNLWRHWHPKSTVWADVSSSMSFRSGYYLLLGSSPSYLTSFALNLFSPGWKPKPSPMLALSAYSKTVNGLELTYLPQRL